MNSNSKFQELESAARVLHDKIRYQISSYQIRKLSASDEYADLARYKSTDHSDYEHRQMVESRLNYLAVEIEFCKKQIVAYQNNDNKSKIIPDRLL